jgi:hypothetical protein
VVPHTFFVPDDLGRVRSVASLGAGGPAVPRNQIEYTYDWGKVIQKRIQTTCYCSANRRKVLCQKAFGDIKKKEKPVERASRVPPVGLEPTTL